VASAACLHSVACSFPVTAWWQTMEDMALAVPRVSGWLRPAL